MRKSRITGLIAAFGLAATFLGGAANAFQVNYTCSAPGGCASNTGATASATFTFTDYAGNPAFAGTGVDVLLTLTVTNTTASPVSALLSAIAFNFPNPPSVTSSDYFVGGTYLTLVGFDEGFGNSSGFNASFDTCAYAPQNCGGSQGNGDFLNGLSDTIYFGFVTTLSAAEVDSAFKNLFAGECQTAVRFQSISGATNGQTSDKVCGSVKRIPDEPLPEPGTLALLGLGLLGLSATRRRKA